MIEPPRRVVWFSCGAASAVVAKLVVQRWGLIDDVQVVYCNTSKNEHPDNLRFIADVEKWVGRKVLLIGNAKFQTVEQVFDNRKYMSGQKGAPCTVELKKKPRFMFQKADDIHHFGMTADESKRAEAFTHRNHELNLEWTLIELGLIKDDCFRILQAAGIKLPEMYLLGFLNNNCIGCVKTSSPKYWNLVRKHFPAVFTARCVQSRAIGCKLTRIKDATGKWVKIYLDELPPDCEDEFEEDLSCGPQCGVVTTFEGIW